MASMTSWAAATAAAAAAAVDATPLAVNVALAAGAAAVTLAAVPASLQLFIDASMTGHDLSKIGRPKMYAAALVSLSWHTVKSTSQADWWPAQASSAPRDL